jgi:ankyrin repeat protein
METRSKRRKTEPVADKIRRGEISVVVAIAEELPDVFIAEILPKLDWRATLNLAQVSKWYNDAVWSVDGVRSMKAKMKAARPNYIFGPLFLAASYGNVPAVRALLKSGVDVDTDLFKGLTPLHCAAEEGHTPVVKALIEAGADVDKRFRSARGHSYTSLHRAAVRGHAPVITELIKAGADVNGTEDHGLAPLHYAVQGRDEDCVALLLAHGADVHKRTSRGIPAMKFAVHHKNKKIIEMLKQAGG